MHEIQLEKVGHWNLFKFSESLQLKMESLLEKKKADQITPDEIAGLDVIGELDRIFTHINTMLAAQNANQQSEKQAFIKPPEVHNIKLTNNGGQFKWLRIL